MKVFLSWSGPYSREIAGCFAEWIPAVLQSVQVFISTKDIGAGERWGTRISGALEEIEFGLVFVTEQNKHAPWLLFEAGALAKNVAVSRVVPILCDAKDDIDFKKNPLSHFQYVRLDKDGVFSAMRSIFEASDDVKIPESVFDKALCTWWPQLAESLDSIALPKDNKKSEVPADEDRLEQIERAVSGLIDEVRNLNKRESEEAIAKRYISNRISNFYPPLASGLISEGFISDQKEEQQFEGGLLSSMLNDDLVRFRAARAKVKKRDGGD